jgi:hypothetical protein
MLQYDVLKQWFSTVGLAEQEGQDWGFSFNNILPTMSRDASESDFDTLKRLKVINLRVFNTKQVQNPCPKVIKKLRTKKTRRQKWELKSLVQKRFDFFEAKKCPLRQNRELTFCIQLI